MALPSTGVVPTCVGSPHPVDVGSQKPLAFLAPSMSEADVQDEAFARHGRQSTDVAGQRSGVPLVTSCAYAPCWREHELDTSCWVPGSWMWSHRRRTPARRQACSRASLQSCSPITSTSWPTLPTWQVCPNFGWALRASLDCLARLICTCQTRSMAHKCHHNWTAYLNLQLMTSSLLVKKGNMSSLCSSARAYSACEVLNSRCSHDQIRVP